MYISTVEPLIDDILKYSIKHKTVRFVYMICIAEIGTSKVIMLALIMYM